MSQGSAEGGTDPKAPMRLTVFGANGGTGAATVEQALAAGQQVTASRGTRNSKKILYVRSIEGRPSIVRTIWEDGIRKKNK